MPGGGGHKPNSVYAAIYLGRASPRGSLRPTRSLERAALERLLTWPCTGWGLPCRPHYCGRGELLPRHFTLTRRETRQAVCFLLHFPSPRGARALPGTLPCGVRTFLTARLAAGQRYRVAPSMFIDSETGGAGQEQFPQFEAPGATAGENPHFTFLLFSARSRFWANLR